VTVRAQQQAEGIDLWQKAEESLFLNPIPRASPTVADEADLKRGLGSPPSDLNAPPPPAHQWFSREKVSIKKPVKSYLVKCQTMIWRTFLFFTLRSHQCAPPPEEAAALLLVAGLRSSMPLPYSVEQISSRLVSCLWFWRLQPHKKTRQIDLCNSFRSFWWPRGSQRRSTVTSRGCGAATGWTVLYFRKDKRPVQDFLRSEVAHPGLGQTRFLIKIIQKARGLYKCIHQVLIKERKEAKQLCFSISHCLDFAWSYTHFVTNKFFCESV